MISERITGRNSMTFSGLSSNQRGNQNIKSETLLGFKQEELVLYMKSVALAAVGLLVILQDQ